MLLPPATSCPQSYREPLDPCLYVSPYLPSLQTFSVPFLPKAPAAFPISHPFLPWAPQQG